MIVLDILIICDVCLSQFHLLKTSGLHFAQCDQNTSKVLGLLDLHVFSTTRAQAFLKVDKQPTIAALVTT